MLPGDTPVWTAEQATIIAKALPEMLRILDLTKPPFIAKIYKDSSVHLTEL